MVIEVHIWGKRVGVLAQSEEGLAFQYDPDFRESNLEISPINMPLHGPDIFVNDSSWKETDGLPGFIYDSLPDRFGNDLLKLYFLDKGLTDKDIDVFTKLRYIGSRGMGALEYIPADDLGYKNELISIQEIEKISSLVTEGKRALETNLRDKHALLKILHIGTSAGGVRAKALIAIHKETGEIRSGQVQHDSEFEYFLIKIDGASGKELKEPSGYGKLEYTYCQMAKECGIDMTDCSLYKEQHFLTKRFDRDQEGNKMHVHSLTGLLGLDFNNIGEYAYEQYFQAARMLDLGNNALIEIFRRMVFNVLAHNCDDHTKNFSFMMGPDGLWKLSPAFDLCYSYDSANEWVSGHNMRINGKRTDITYHDLMEVGKKFNIKNRKHIVKQIKSVIDQFPEYAQKVNVPNPLIEEVEKNRPRIVLNEPLR